MLFKTRGLEKYKLEGAEGNIGNVKEFYFDDKYWAVRYLVADTGNWLVGRQILISPYTIGSIDKEEETIATNLSEKQIEESPSLESDKPVSHQFEVAYYGYYGFPAYWTGSHMWGNDPYLSRDYKNLAKESQKKDAWDPHLRSTIDVRGHHIQANDGEIGHVEDFILDDKTWAIRYLVIDTKNWWGGKKVLISPRWIDKVSWDELKVFVHLSRERIKQSPEYSDDFLLTRDYEDQLHKHYDLKGYWEDESAYNKDA